ncbi:MAG: hypothetical protein ACOX9R_01695 [Armatimonadota bacterium]
MKVWFSPGIRARRELIRICWPVFVWRRPKCASVYQSIGSNAIATPLSPSHAQVSGRTAEMP